MADAEMRPFYLQVDPNTQRFTNQSKGEESYVSEHEIRSVLTSYALVLVRGQDRDAGSGWGD
jgi:hypothetical protein